MINRQGFTLAEVIISVLILVVTVAGLLASFLTAKGIVARTGRKIQAMDFSFQTLEGLKNEVRPTWDDLGEPLRIGGWGPWLALGGDFGTKFSGQRRYKVDPVPNVDKDTGYRTVTVVIDWQEP